MMILEAGEICPHKNSCPYNVNSMSGKPCYGTLLTRKNTFHCEFVVNGQIIHDAGIRLPGDITGKMKVILE